MHNSSTSVNLLVPNGIVRVTFSVSLTNEQSVAFLRATEMAESIEELKEALQMLANVWGITVTTEVLSRKQPAKAS